MREKQQIRMVMYERQRLSKWQTINDVSNLTSFNAAHMVCLEGALARRKVRRCRIPQNLARPCLCPSHAACVTVCPGSWGADGESGEHRDDSMPARSGGKVPGSCRGGISLLTTLRSLLSRVSVRGAEHWRSSERADNGDGVEGGRD